MAGNSITIERRLGDVLAMLTDPYRYAEWVLGAWEIVDADESWPQPGASFRFQLGAPPLLFEDRTSVVAYEPPDDGRARLVLRARLSLIGQAQIDLELEQLDGPRETTRVRMTERPASGPWRWGHNPAQDCLLRARNALSLRRFKQLVEDQPVRVPRAEATAGAGAQGG